MKARLLSKLLAALILACCAMGGVMHFLTAWAAGGQHAYLVQQIHFFEEPISHTPLMFLVLCGLKVLAVFAGYEVLALVIYGVLTFGKKKGVAVPVEAPRQEEFAQPAGLAAASSTAPQPAPRITLRGTGLPINPPAERK